MKKISWFILALFFLVSLSGCDSKDRDDVIRVAYFPNITHAQALVIKDKKMLEEALGSDYKVEWLDFNAGPSEVEAFYAGEVDIGYIGPVPAITAHQNSKGEMRIVAGAANGGSVLVSRPNLNLSGPDQLENLTVAVPKLGNTQHLLLLKVLSDVGLNPAVNGGNVNVIAVNNADMVSAMDQKRIDVALVPEPWGSILQNVCDAQLVMDYSDIWMNGDYATTVIMSSQDFLKGHEDLVKIFLNVHKDATEYIMQNEDEAKEIVNRQIELLTGQKLDINIMNQAYSRIELVTEVPVKSIFEYAQINFEQDFIKELPGDDLIDGELLNQ